MGLSRLTALLIQDNEVTCTTNGPCENKKYVGLIAMSRNRWHPLVSTEAVYDTAESAKAAMEELVQQVKKMDLLSSRK